MSSPVSPDENLTRSSENVASSVASSGLPLVPDDPARGRDGTERGRAGSEPLMAAPAQDVSGQEGAARESATRESAAHESMVRASMARPDDAVASATRPASTHSTSTHHARPDAALLTEYFPASTRTSQETVESGDAESDLVPAPPLPPMRRQVLPSAMGLLAIAALFASLWACWANEAAGALTSMVLQFVLGGAACCACWFSVTRVRNESTHPLHNDSGTQWGFTLVGISAALFCLGQIALWRSTHFVGTATWNEISLLTGDDIQSSQLWWALSVPSLWIGLLMMARLRGTPQTPRLLLDVIITGFAILVLIWATVLQAIVLDGELSTIDKTLALYFPLNYLAMLLSLLTLIVTSAEHSEEKDGLASVLPWLIPGVMMLLAANGLALRSALQGNLSALPWLSGLLRCWGWALTGLAAWRLSVPSVEEGYGPPQQSSLTLSVQRWRTRWQRALEPGLDRWHGPLTVWLPYGSALGVCAVLVVREWSDSGNEFLSHILPVLLLMLAIAARQMITLLENVRLSEALRGVNHDLELNVAERTRHLATLHAIASTLNSSLSRRAVLRSALEETVAAVGADGGGIWLYSPDGAPPIGDDAPGWDVTEYGDPVPEWTLADWHGIAGATPQDDQITQLLLRDLTLASLGNQLQYNTVLHLASSTRRALQQGAAPPAHQLIMIPLAWRGTLLGALSVVRRDGAFSYDARALVESVALEAAVALQNARLYWEASQRADRDGVTGLLNHRAMQEHLNAVIARARRNNHSISVVMMDLNNFKFFNDTYGHPAGDRVLQNVASCLREACRRGDFVGRFGGDEFIIILPDTEARDAFDACQRVATALDRRHFEGDAGLTIPIGASFGWATYPHDADNAAELLARADASLYRNKRGGGLPLAASGEGENPLEEREAWKKLRQRSWGGNFSALDALITAVDNKDRYTRHHSEEVTRLALHLAREMGWDAEQLQALRISGLLHDVGKIAVPDDILRHPGRLGEEEARIMQQHPSFGALIIKDLPHLEQVLEGVRSHHERWDGQGYPDGLSGEGIPLMGRILAVADCYSAMTTDRPYRKGRTHEEALDEIEALAGTQFDPQIAPDFVRLMRRGNSKEQMLRADAIETTVTPPAAQDGVPASSDGAPSSAPVISAQA